MTEKLLEKRVGVSAGEFPKLVSCSWPLGSVTMYRDRLVVNAGVERYELAYRDIDRLQINAFQVNIEHHHPDVIDDITINGILAARRIRRTVEQHRLPVRIA